MSIVTINEKYRVLIDPDNHTLERFSEGGIIRHGERKGELSAPTWLFEGYYPNLLQCLRRVIRLEVMALPDTDLKGYIERLERLNEEFICKP